MFLEGEMMKKLLAIGEALVDIFEQNEVKVGGAPLNVLGAYSKLGGESYFLGKVSNDEYGRMILESMNKYNIKNDYVVLSDAPTAKALVTTLENGDREFEFIRHNSADQLLTEEEVKEECFKDTFALHFCSVCLDDYPIKKAHYKAIEYAKRNNCLISFDLNIRLGLFKYHQKLKATILEFIGYSNIVKLSIEELEWLGVESVNSLFVNDVKMIVLTLGKDGSKCYLKDGTIIKSKGIKVDAVDTTGAGDGFVGSFLYQLSNNKENLDEISKDKIQKYMDFSNRFCSLSVTKKGAIDSYPTKEEMKRVI